MSIRIKSRLAFRTAAASEPITASEFSYAERLLARLAALAFVADHAHLSESGARAPSPPTGLLTPVEVPFETPQLLDTKEARDT